MVPRSQGDEMVAGFCWQVEENPWSEAIKMKPNYNPSYAEMLYKAKHAWIQKIFQGWVRQSFEFAGGGGGGGCGPP